MNVKIETITPSIAESYLKKNTRNRKIREPHVYFLRDEISEGRWTPNGATIVFGNKQLLDGQHRLLAVMAAKKAIKSLVVHGVPDEFFSTIDMGAPRRPADTLLIKGETNTGKLSAAIMWVIRYKNNMQRKKSSATLVEKFLETNGGIRKSVELCNKIKLMSGPVAAAGHYLFSQKNEALASKLLSGIADGVGLDRGDPIYLLRERLVENFASKAKLHAVHQFALLVSTWNALRKKEPLAIEKNGAELARTGKFPEII
jgi:hypothetical protein